MIDIISIAGKQYVVKPGAVVTVPHLDLEKDAKVECDGILSGKKVSAVVIDQIKDDKIIIRKFHNKTRYRRTQGHRQALTRIRIAKDVVKAEPKKAEVEVNEVKEAVIAA